MQPPHQPDAIAAPPPEGPYPLMLTGPGGALCLAYPAEFAHHTLLPALGWVAEHCPDLDAAVQELIWVISHPRNRLIPEGMRLATLGGTTQPLLRRAATCRTGRHRPCDPERAMALVAALVAWPMVSGESCFDELTTTLAVFEMKGIDVDYAEVSELPNGDIPLKLSAYGHVVELVIPATELAQ